MPRRLYAKVTEVALDGLTQLQPDVVIASDSTGSVTALDATQFASKTLIDLDANGVEVDAAMLSLARKFMDN